ncbi:MAG: hypothetical protein KJ970_13870 [Candidatus Eisenbacteria bacterium]|uniref:Uncharacterized protein n=1 Tax=Eiseniibacteriota bacterium TaxID=2212470 RepID=A0A948WDM7_UNCEI|nr:hypothetical protein [Candidatus Eisenbacteria bacterium]MBU2692003.1 hypothetical protein [Candidatus Eisenbacteria bacterium]
MARKQTKPATKKDTKKTQSEQKAKDAKQAPKTAETTPKVIEPESAPKATKPEPAPKPNVTEPLVVFAFRLTRAERDLIHRVAGSAKASKFVKGVVLATARGDLDTVKKILEEGIS